MTDVSPPGVSLGVVGGGQLGRMMAEHASPLGVDLIILDPSNNAPAASVAKDHIIAPFDSEPGMLELAEASDVLTYEIELADPDILERVSTKTGTPVEPSPDTLRMIQDKLVQNRTLDEASIQIPRFRPADDIDDVEKACAKFGYPVMLKARSGGYDGRGNVPIHSPDEIEEAYEAIAGPAVVEEFIEFVRELSVIGVKGKNDRRCYVPAENIHEDEILRESIVPARISDDIRDIAIETAHEVLDQLVGRGVYGIELFEGRDGTILVNEIAPRPHNSGHWTIEGAVTSQFEQHVRAVLGSPLGSTALRTPIVTANILGDTSADPAGSPRGIEPVLRSSEAHLHWYGKRAVWPLRKMGHISVYHADSQDRDALLEAARTYATSVTFRPSEE